MICSEEHNGTHTVRLGGDVFLSEIHDLRSALEQAAASDAKHIVLDFSGVRYIVAQTIGLIASLHRGTQSAGRRLRLVNVDRRLVRIFEFVGFDRIVTITENRGPEGERKSVGSPEKKQLWPNGKHAA